MDEHSYGVIYNPDTVGSDQPPALTPDLLDLHNIHFIRITWVDWTNTTRYRILPRPYFLTLLSSPRPGISLARCVFGLVALTLAPGFSGTGEYHYLLDTASFRVAPYAPGHATVFGFFEYTSPHPVHGLAVPLCPRTMLARVVERAEKHGPVNSADWCVSAKLPSGSVEGAVMEDIARKLMDAGIELQMYHGESAPGQYEVVTGPLTSLAAADALVCTRETIYNVARAHGLRATFAPRLFKDSCGTAAHTHISVHSSTPCTPRADDSIAPTLTPAERSFISGILTHLSALPALTLPTRASYARVADGVWSGGTYATWGVQQREAPLRVCGARGAVHIEVRCVDATASPYLALAGLLGAGTEAVIRGELLSVPDVGRPVAEMSERERRESGLEGVGRVPASLEQARVGLREDEELVGVLGREFVEAYLAVNETMEQMLEEGTEEARMQRLVQYY